MLQELRNDFFLRMMDNSPQVFYIVRIEMNSSGEPEDWTYVYCNDAAAKLGKIPKEQMKGHRFSEVFPNGSTKWLKIYYRAACLDETFDFDEFSDEIGTYLHFKISPSGQDGYCFCYAAEARKEIYKNMQSSSIKMKQGTELNQNAFLDALCVDFTVVYLCDLKKDTLTVIKANPYSHNAEADRDLPINERNSYSARFRYFYDHVIVHESVPDFLEKMLPDGLMQTLAYQDSYEARLRSIRNQAELEYFAIKVVRLYHDDDSFQVVIGVMPINEQVRKEQENQKRLEEALISLKQSNQKLEDRNLILAALSNDFDAIYLCDLMEDTLQIVKESEKQISVDADSGSYMQTGRDFFNHHVEKDSAPDMLNMLERENLMPYLMEHQSYTIRYRVKPDASGRTFIETKIVHVESDRGFKIVIGTRFIDDIVREQNERNERLQGMLEEEQIKNEIISAISTLYMEIAIVDLENMTYELVAAPGNNYAKKGNVGTVTHLKELLLDKNVFADSRAEVEEFIDFSTINERLADKQYIQRELKAVSGKWYDCKFIVKRRNDVGDVTHVLMAVRDIDEQKLHELEYQERLKEAKEEAEIAKIDAERANDAKTNFLRRMSHDIRTPINGIRGMVQIENHYENDPVKAKECRNKIWKATDHLLSLVNDVLDMNKLESGRFTLRHEPFSLKKTLDEVHVVSEAQAEECNVHFVHQNTGEIEHDHLLGSPVYLKRIFMNFTSNAIKYNREGGMVSVYGRELSFDGKTAWYEFVCEDNGIGMSEEFQKHAFEPFTQEEQSMARTKYSGTGLGLAISKQLLDLLGGTLELESALGKGTKVTFRIPLDVDLEAHTKKEDIDYSKINFDGIKALLVEDNDLNAEIATFLLEQHGIAVRWVQNGKLAVEELNKNREGYDVVLMDVMMPVMNGLEAAKAIRTELKSNTPIFAMTANAFIDDFQQSYDAGMNEHLTKPLREKDIVRALLKYVKQ